MAARLSMRSDGFTTALSKACDEIIERIFVLPVFLTADPSSCLLGMTTSLPRHSERK